MIVGRVGERAYYDGISGLVPCIVFGVTKGSVKVRMDAKRGVRSWHGINEYGDWDSEEEFDASHVVPEKAIRWPDAGKFHPTIMPYRWEPVMDKTAELPAEVEGELSIMAAERGCDRETEYTGCEECSSYDECVVKARELAATARGGSSVQQTDGDGGQVPGKEPGHAPGLDRSQVLPEGQDSG